MAICKNCGNKISKNDTFCENCGCKVVAEKEYTQQAPVAAVQPVNSYNQPQYVAIAPDPNKNTLSAWAFFGYSILFVVPVLGLIFNLIFCFNSSNLVLVYHRCNCGNHYRCKRSISFVFILSKEEEKYVL